MSKLYGKIEYLKGLADGLKISKETKEGEMLLAIVNALSDMAYEVDELYEVMTEIDEDLNEVEDELYGDDEFGELDDDEMFEIACPNCDELVLVDDDMLADDKIICPNCNEEIEFDFDCDCCGCDDE